MLKCSSCAGKFVRGKLCLDCGKAYCGSENISDCPFCRSRLVEAEVTEEVIGQNIIEWLHIGNIQMGFVDFRQIPPYILRTLHSSGFKSIEKYRLVLFPSKRSSWEVTNYFRRKMGIPTIEYQKSFEKSRYALVEDPDSKKLYIFLNMSAAAPNIIEFLTVFLSNLVSRIKKFRKSDNEILAEALGKALFNHNAKLGISFITGDEITKEYFEILQDNVIGIYSEYTTLEELSEDFLKEMPTFLSQKIELLFSKIEYDRLFYLRGVYDLFNIFIQVSSFLALAQGYQPLKQYVNNVFNLNRDEVKKRLKGDFSDVLKSLGMIVGNLSQKKAYKSYKSYSESVAETLKCALGILRPKYLRFSEIGSLFQISKEYERKIEIGMDPYLPKFGTVDEFSRLLLRLNQRNDIFPEMRIVAGQSLLSILTFRIWKKNDYVSYLQGLELVQELARLIVDNVPAMKSRMGRTERECGLIGYHDACLALMAFSQFSSAMNDADSVLRLTNLSKHIAQKHKVLTIQTVHGWKDFVETHNYDRLLDVHNSFLAIDYSEHRYVEEYVRTIGHLSIAVFKTESKEDEFDKAENHALAITDFTPPTETLMSYLAQAIQSSEAMYHLVRLFRHIMEANEVDIVAPLKRARLESRAMSATIPEIDPLNNFALKTEILYSLITGDRAQTQKACKRLKDRSSHETSVCRLGNNVEKWLSESDRLKGRRFLIRVDTSEADPWERLFKKIVHAKANEDLDKNIVGADAIVFVEGISDTKILGQFAKTLVPGRKILFMDVVGFTNMKYYSEARIAEKLRVPLFVLFDGDTSAVQTKKRIKELVVRRITLPKTHMLTLERNSIEGYLLVPNAIKKAFPSIQKTTKDIEAFLRGKRTKRNKRQVLGELFDQLGLGKYDYEKGLSIASKLSAPEIDEEIKEIFHRILG